jgi:HTH-type transcriptional regulator/antitoxin HipB
MGLEKWRRSRLECTIVHSKLEITKADARSIGDSVRHAREALGMRQDELALAAGVSTRAIHQIESGKPTSRLDTVSPVLAALGLTLRVEASRASGGLGDR